LVFSWVVATTDPVTKQKRFSQYWPASTLAGDAVAVVCDDPDTVFKAAVVTTQGGTAIGSANLAVVGLNLSASDLAGNINTGDSYNAVLAPTTTPSTGVPIRIIDVVDETAFAIKVWVHLLSTDYVNQWSISRYPYRNRRCIHCC
jgi:hypothetical protein